MTGSKYLRIADDLRRAIQNGDFSPGDTLPSGSELVNQYEVARGTVRQAITTLAQEGLVTPMPGVGTVVRETAAVALRYTPAKPSPTWMESNAGDETARDELIHVVWAGVDYDVAQRLGIEVDDLALHRVRYQFRGSGTAPVQVHDQWIPEPVVGVIRDSGVDLAKIDADLPADLYTIMKTAGLALVDVVETIGARMPDPEERDTLRLPVGVPVLTTLRVTRGENETPLETSDFVSASDRCTQSFTMSLTNHH